MPLIPLTIISPMELIPIDDTPDVEHPGPQITSVTEPIPLRALTLLLNYERMVSNPKFKGVRLFRSSASDPSMITSVLRDFPDLFDKEPATIESRQYDFFECFVEPHVNDHPDTICLIHPNAPPITHTLTVKRRENIYYQTRAMDGCYKAIGLFKLFFEHCPPGQQVSIQIQNEKPILVEVSLRFTLELTLRGPKLRTLYTIPDIGDPDHEILTSNGSLDEQRHIVQAFAYSGNNDGYLIVDMTRFQYGEAGRGSFGETYFIGSWTEYIQSMAKICESVEVVSRGLEFQVSDGEYGLTMRDAAAKVWNRWEDRAIQAWCDYCGKGGPGLKTCGGCMNVKVSYCCREHQLSAWKLHKHTCERVKAGE